MSLESSRSLSKTPPRKRPHTLKMETIPMSSYPDLKEAHTYETHESLVDDQRMNSQEEEEYTRVKPNASSFEADDGFKFKRHKNKQSNGAPSLGERLDNLQDIKKAKWVDNFNSSMPNARERSDNDRDKLSPRVQASQQSLPSSQPPVSQVAGPAQAAPYMPYMYYYPMPTQAHPMMPYVGSPLHPSQMEVPQYMNSSMSVMPNSSLQPFFPPPIQPQNHDSETPQLLPAPPLYPYNYVQSNQQYMQKCRDRRKSIAYNRGRRLSMLASQDEHHGIISPHKDISEQDFYRHIGNTSFGKGLQMRQLFSWCLIRSLRNLEKQEYPNNMTRQTKGDGYVDPKRIALIIVREFVNELRRGSIDIDWETEEAANSSEDEINDTGEDTELRELFQDDDDDSTKEARGTTLVRRKKARAKDAKRPKIPNSKNVANEKSLEILQSRVDNIKKEIKSWATVLEHQRPEVEWQNLEKQLSLSNTDTRVNNDDESSMKTVYQDLTRRLDRLQIHSHFLNSSSEALSLLLKDRQDKLSRNLASTVNDSAQEIDPKMLLKGLSKSLTKK